MREMDPQYLETPFYGSRQMKAWLERQGKRINRKRVQWLKRDMGLRAMYQRPRTSQPTREQRLYPYLLWSSKVTWSNQGWPLRSRTCP